MGRTIKLLLSGAMLAAAVVAAMVYVAYRATQVEPDFYARAMRADEHSQEEAGDELERRVLDLHNHARHEGKWSAVFTDQQINGWLAADLPKKFPRALPRGAQDPRISIQSAVAHVGCRYESDKLSSVVWLAVHVDLAEEDNLLAIRIAKARAGALPIPLKDWLDRIAQGARRAGIPLRWTHVDGDPVALVPISIRRRGQKNRQLVIETIEMREGELHVAGRTEACGDSQSRGERLQVAIYLPSSNATSQR